MTSDCPCCGQRLPEAGNVPVRCQACGREVPARPLYRPVLLDGGTEAVASPIPDLPAPPRPLQAVLVATSNTEIEAGDSGLQRCARCGARVAPSQSRCALCNAALVADDERPWDRPGGMRRDYEPHRGTLLLALGRIALVLAICGLLGVCFFPFALASVLALAVGGTALVLAARDLEEIRQRKMDPEGEDRTYSAQRLAQLAVVLSGVTILLGVMIHLPWLLQVLP